MVPITCGKRELVGEGDTKMFGIGWPKTSPACGVWRASPLFLTRARARARMWLTRTGQDQGAAWHDGGELELSQTWTLCRTSSTSSPAEGTRSTVHNNWGLFSMGYLKPFGCGIAGRLLDTKVMVRSLKLSRVLEIRNTSRACLRSLITQEHFPERNGVKHCNNWH